jgi:dTMP kinase
MNQEEIQKFANKFIVFEGTDSTGKSSVAKLFVDKLNNAGINTRLTFQPGDPVYGPIATTIRSFCKDKRWGLSSYGNLFAFLLDRAEAVHNIIRPSLKIGQTVVSDRYTYSTVAYQLMGKNLYNDIKLSCGEVTAQALLSWFIDPYPDIKPDIVYYFPEKIGERKDNDFDLFDKESFEFNQRVSEAYEQMYIRQVPEGTKWIKLFPGKTAEETLDKLICRKLY